MVSPQFHINQNDLFEIVRPTAGNPPTYYNWQALSVQRNLKKPIVGPRNAAPQRAELHKDVINREGQKPPTNDREEDVVPMEDIHPTEEDMPPSEVDGTHTPSQYPSQEAAAEAEAPKRTSSRIRKAYTRALESREQESVNWNTVFAAVQGQEEGQHYYEAMNKDD